jgi:hypothetical protein
MIPGLSTARRRRAMFGHRMALAVIALSTAYVATGKNAAGRKTALRQKRRTVRPRVKTVSA